MVYGADLESRYAREGIVGSNPTPSAHLSLCQHGQDFCLDVGDEPFCEMRLNECYSGRKKPVRLSAVIGHCGDSQCDELPLVKGVYFGGSIVRLLKLVDHRTYGGALILERAAGRKMDRDASCPDVHQLAHWSLIFGGSLGMVVGLGKSA